ncbi:subtilase family protein [Neolewinella xylanilytica]|uniref:Subtilase family protein n=1 Tax=Neolewinella xylanilytica TaxID=1514080 RepID=A0A2S6I7Q2_9BACT|nr:S8 family serine peptidase [Neolewinella xylanilytica]PPK87508.1 subtilase family protein [Neolewinella xylanilytica]
MYTMTAYEKSTPRLTYSDPEQGEHPRLTRFDRLEDQAEGKPLPIHDDKPVARRYRVLMLPRTDAGEVFLHVYNTTQLGLRLRYYGLNRGGSIEPLPGCDEIGGVLSRLPLRLADGFDAYLVRFGIGLGKEDDQVKLGELDYFSVAAYAGKEPVSPGGIRLARPDRPKGEGDYLPFSHNGRSFQRLVISTCDPGEDIRSLAKATGLEMAETYFGKLGSVIAVGVPPGMSLNTGVDTTQVIRQKGHSGEGNVSEDYILNLFSPKEPTTARPGFTENTDEPADGATEFRPPHPQQFDCDQQPLTVALIDSGIDYGSANATHWKSTRYERGSDTEYITPGRYGYDFIRRQEEPIDEAPHGTYVAATVLNQYTAARPLQLLHMKVFGAEGIASYFGSLVSIYEATLAGAKVINMSWGFYQQEEPRALHCAIKTAADRGVFLVASAGNDTENLDAVPQWPAGFADDFPCNLVTVASYWYPDPSNPDPASIELTNISNYGQWEVPVAAFLTSPVPRFTTGETHFPVGTSISAPILAGQLANWLADNPAGSLSRFRKEFYRNTPSLASAVTRGSYLPHLAGSVEV